MNLVMADSRKNEGFTLSVSLSFFEISWGRVRDQLISRYGLKPEDVDQALRRFHEAFLTPFEVYWFKNRSLSDLDNRIICAICDIHGADVLSISHTVSLGERLHYRIIVQFSPRFRSDDSPPSCNPLIVYKLGKREVTVSRPYQLYLIRLSIFSVATMLYIVVVGSLLYSLSMAIVFTEYPSQLVLHAYRSPFAGICLIITLLALALAVKGVIYRLRNRPGGKSGES